MGVWPQGAYPPAWATREVLSLCWPGEGGLEEDLSGSMHTRVLVDPWPSLLLLQSLPFLPMDEAPLLPTGC